MTKKGTSQKSLSPTFQETVAQIRREYPEEAKNVTFVDIASRNWRQGVRSFLGSISASTRATHMYEFNALYLLQQMYEEYSQPEGRRRKTELPDEPPEDEAAAVKMYLRAVESFPSSFAFKDFDTGRSIVFLARKGHINETSHGTLYHEFGHIAVPGGINDHRDEEYKLRAPPEIEAISLKREIAADGFECLHALKKSAEGRQKTEALSLARAFEYFSCGGTSHLTTIALDKILVTEKDIVRSLTPQQIKAVAAAHAKECEISSTDTQNLGYVHVKWAYTSWLFEKLPPAEQRAQEMAVFAKWAHEYEKEDSNTYYIADKILRHVLKTGEIPYPAAQKVDTSIPEWDDIKKRLAGRRPAAEVRAEKWRQQSPLKPG